MVLSDADTSFPFILTHGTLNLIATDLLEIFRVFKIQIFVVKFFITSLYGLQSTIISIVLVILVNCYICLFSQSFISYFVGSHFLKLL